MPAHAAKPKTWKVNLKDADINALISEVAEVTGRNFIVDPRVKGSVTVISNKALNANELYQMFLGVLSVNGFAAVPSGTAIKIVPDVTAKQYGVPVEVNLSKKEGDALVTRVIRLDNTNAVDLVPVLRPMMPQFAHLAAVPSANALVLSDHASNIESLTKIINQLDTNDGSEIEVIPLQNARVDDVVSMLESLTGPAGAGAAAAKDAKQLYRVRVVADPRSNRLLLKGDASGRERLRQLIATLDMPSERLGGVRVFRLKHASAKEVADVLRGLVTGEGGRSASSSSGTSGAAGASSAPVAINANGVGIIADDSLNALVVKADPAVMQEISSVIDQLDQRRSQVLIQAAIVEVSGDNARKLGVQWAAGDPTKGVGLINFSTAGTSLANIGAAVAANNPALANVTDGAAIGIGREDTNANGDKTFYGALIQALSTVTNANLLSTPSIMTLDNQEAKIVVGQNVPFITGSTTSAANTTTNPFQTIERQDVGITLRVVPHIGEGGTMRLEIEQEVSAVVPSSSTGVNAADIITSKRSIKTTVLADNGQTIVLGGLISDNNTKTVSKVPLLGDIPLLGYLFRATSNTKTKQNLLVFLQPILLRDSVSAADLSQREYEAIRTLDMAVSKGGKVTRLPEKVDEIYQGTMPAPQQPEASPQQAPQATPAAPVQEAPQQEAPTQQETAPGASQPLEAQPLPEQQPKAAPAQP